MSPTLAALMTTASINACRARWLQYHPVGAEVRPAACLTFLLRHARYAYGVWCIKAMLLGRWLEGGVIIFRAELIWFASHLPRHLQGRLLLLRFTSPQTMWLCATFEGALPKSSVHQKFATT